MRSAVSKEDHASLFCCMSLYANYPEIAEAHKNGHGYAALFNPRLSGVRLAKMVQESPDIEVLAALHTNGDGNSEKSPPCVRNFASRFPLPSLQGKSTTASQEISEALQIS